MLLIFGAVQAKVSTILNFLPLVPASNSRWITNDDILEFGDV